MISAQSKDEEQPAWSWKYTEPGFMKILRLKDRWEEGPSRLCSSIWTSIVMRTWGPQHGPQVQVSHLTTSLGVPAVIIWAASTVGIRFSFFSVPIQGHLCEDQNSLSSGTPWTTGDYVRKGQVWDFSSQVMWSLKVLELGGVGIRYKRNTQ